MITRKEYLEALETVRKYREQVKSEMKDSASLPEHDKFLSEFEIPRRIQKVLGEIYLFDLNDEDFKNHTWESCFKLIKLSDLKSESYKIKNVSKRKGAGPKLIIELRKVYKGLNLL